MTTPALPHSWLTPAAVAAALPGIDEAALPPAVEQARAAAGAYVERVRADLFTSEGVEIGGDVLAGAALLTARLHARKGSPLGLASFAEFGPSAVLRLDPDIERLLGLGRYAKPRIG